MGTSRTVAPAEWPSSWPRTRPASSTSSSPALPHLRARRGLDRRGHHRRDRAATRCATGSRRRRRPRSRRWSGRWPPRRAGSASASTPSGPGMLTDGMAARLIASGELSDEAPRRRPPQHPAAPLRHRHRHRRGGLLPRLRPRRLHLRPEAGRRRRLRRVGLLDRAISPGLPRHRRPVALPVTARPHSRDADHVRSGGCRPPGAGYCHVTAASRVWQRTI